MLWLGYGKQHTCEFLTLNRISALRSCCLWQLLNRRFPDFFSYYFWKNRKKWQVVISLKAGDTFPVIALPKWLCDKSQALLYVFFLCAFFLPSVSSWGVLEWSSTVLGIAQICAWVVQCTWAWHVILCTHTGRTQLPSVHVVCAERKQSVHCFDGMATRAECIQRRFFCTLRGAQNARTLLSQLLCGCPAWRATCLSTELDFFCRVLHSRRQSHTKCWKKCSKWIRRQYALQVILILASTWKFLLLWLME